MIILGVILAIVGVFTHRLILYIGVALIAVGVLLAVSGSAVY